MKRVVHSSQKERERESMSVRHPDTPGEIVSMLKEKCRCIESVCTYALDREIYSAFVGTGRDVVHLRVKVGSTH